MMEGLAKKIFEDLTTANQAAAEHMAIGRAQMAREVIGWVHAHAHLLGGVPIETLLSMCRKELKP